ncbi:oxidoreductase [Streptomyces sp. NA02950]|uniref:oxidoreductase n=1 Tax=Streptomyces sp. NA02950 TaxID=2742137 RepID=UPI001590F37A|nr:oxidoreductase [Streptomyces sp. NA02950]QKV91771.1 oxidoreductase [Streptomyces sp. NA02950]
MSFEYVTFGLTPAIRVGGVLADGAYQMHRDFLDFTVDGGPLLPRLPDLDVVSSLALDLGPAAFTEQVSGLLLETDAPLEGGRFVIYGCPECEGLECGALTAVIERDGPDVVWRDFVWQTDHAAPDAERDALPGIGPYRFRGDQYRTELKRLLADDGPEGRPGPRALLIGRRAAVLAKLAAALRRIGIGAEITLDAAGAHPDELRKYGAVVFGRAVGRDERDAVRDACAAARADVVFVTALAPIVPLLVAQVEQALDRTPFDRRGLTGLRASGAGAAVEAFLEVASPCRVRLVAHRMDRLSRSRTWELFDAPLEPGTHRLVPDLRAVRGEAYLVAHTRDTVLVTPVARQ